MKRTEIINNRIVNWVEQHARFLRHNDVFKKPTGSTHYRFEALDADQNLVVCENLDTHTSETIHANSPVYRLLLV
jgi:hypothetical protein